MQKIKQIKNKNYNRPKPNKKTKQNKQLNLKQKVLDGYILKVNPLTNGLVRLWFVCAVFWATTRVRVTVKLANQSDRGVNTRPLTECPPPIGQVKPAGWHTQVLRDRLPAVVNDGCPERCSEQTGVWVKQMWLSICLTHTQASQSCFNIANKILQRCFRVAEKTAQSHPWFLQILGLSWWFRPTKVLWTTRWKKILTHVLWIEAIVLNRFKTA